MERNTTYGFILSYWSKKGNFLKTGESLAGELTRYLDKNEIGGVAMDRENNVFIVDLEKSKFKNKKLFLNLKCEKEGKKTKMLNFIFEIDEKTFSVAGKWDNGWAGIMFLPNNFGGYFYGIDN